ncbi:hypothetical protein QTO34_004164, partial [Cnephaeus nilssonii]
MANYPLVSHSRTSGPPAPHFTSQGRYKLPTALNSSFWRDSGDPDSYGEKLDCLASGRKVSPEEQFFHYRHSGSSQPIGLEVNSSQCTNSNQSLTTTRLCTQPTKGYTKSVHLRVNRSGWDLAPQQPSHLSMKK